MAQDKDKRYFLTSESVTEGHPDKMADQIADAILDAIYAEDPHARVACEVFLTRGLVMVGGEISTSCYVDVLRIARNTIVDIGYNRAKMGFDGETCAVVSSIDEQSPDIALGVNRSLEAKEGTATDDIEHLGAGDQGMVYGFACDETPQLMPLPIVLAHDLARRLAFVRKNNILPYLWPDGKTQVTVEYDGFTPVRVDAVVVSAQHMPDVDHDTLARGIEAEVIRPVLPAGLVDSRTRYYVNPTGRFVLGGPAADTGLTGRKIIVDTYGGAARHGGGAFSGKDPTKVDRSAAYAARYVAKNLVAAGLCRRAEVAVSYAIGVERPLSISVDTFGTGIVPDTEILALVRQFFDLRPGAIIKNFDLRRPMYRQLACYGHFGRTDLDLPWEKTDKAELLRQAAGLDEAAASQAAD